MTPMMCNNVKIEKIDKTFKPFEWSTWFKRKFYLKVYIGMNTGSAGTRFSVHLKYTTLSNGKSPIVNKNHITSLQNLNILHYEKNS